MPQYLTCRLIRQEDEWDAIRLDWDALHSSSPDASPPLDFGWLRAWWRIYGPTYGTGGLRIVTVWRGQQLIGALPLYEGRCADSPFAARQLQFLSTGEAEYEETCPDYLNALCRRGEEAACLTLMWKSVERLAWDQLKLLDIRRDSPILQSGALPRRAQVSLRGSCPIADLTDGFETYLGRLSSNSRQQARRLLREGERAGARLEIGISGAFDDLVLLHQERWTAERRPGVFAAPRFTAFHRELIREWAPDGKAILARLSVGDAPVAVLYGFVIGSRFHFYQSGVRRDGTGLLRSPGNLAHLRLMQALAERGVTQYDFLRGTSSYKDRLATDENQLASVQLWRPTVRAAACRSSRLAARVARRGLRQLSQQRVPR
jgi:CelD/BcsL family acetyltransferase involved in cellulose biosynthesis